MTPIKEHRTMSSLEQRVKNYLTPAAQSTDEVRMGFTALVFTPDEKLEIAGWDTTGAPVELAALTTTTGFFQKKDGSPWTWGQFLQIVKIMDDSAKQSWTQQMENDGMQEILTARFGADYFEKYAYTDPATGELTMSFTAAPNSNLNFIPDTVATS
jgi:hypothetical protein